MDANDIEQLLRACHIPIDPSIITTAFADDSQREATRTWAAQHLSRDTLLSKNEVEQYAVLEKAGKVESLAASADVSLVRPISDDELRDAISELNRSTEAIRKQTAVLKSQEEALARLVQDNGKGADRRAELLKAYIRNGDREQEEAVAQLQEVTKRVEVAIADLGSADESTHPVTSLVEDVLRHDDKLITSLLKLGKEIPVIDPAEQESLAKIRDLCARLIKFDVECIRAKLDRVYLEALQTSPTTRDAGTTEDLVALEEEVESLYAEILPVAQMSAQQQFLDPATRSANTRGRTEGMQSDKAFAYILHCLDYLLNRTQCLMASMEEWHAHQQAAAQLVSVARAELAVDTTLPEPKPARRPTMTGSPTRRRKSSGTNSTTSPLRLRNTHRRRSSGGVGADEPPIDTLLREVGVVLPMVGNDGNIVASSTGRPASANNPDMRSMQLAAISSALADREEKVADIGRSVQTSFESSTSNHLADTRRALLLVRESILAESPFGPARLADQAVETSIEFLAQGIDAMQTRLASVDTKTMRAGGGITNSKREEIVARWAKP